MLFSFQEDANRREDFVRLLNAEDKLAGCSIAAGTTGCGTKSHPRFTYDELRKILVECMQLQSELIQVEDQLEVYRRAG